jgi:predicted nucleotidyltransferase
MNVEELALNNIVLRGLVGSAAYGLAADGVSDRDEMGIFIEAPENVCGLNRVDHYIKRDRPDGVRSEPGDLDLTLYSLRKFCHLSAVGNPSILMLLWLPTYITKHPLVDRLIAMRESFISRDAGQAFHGYLVQQRKRLTGDRTRTVNRPELVEKYGYDTKFASHALRLGLQGIELLTEGGLTLPIKEPDLSVLRDMKFGNIPFDDALALIADSEKRLASLVDMCTLAVDRKKIDTLLVDIHMEYWK